VINVGDDGDIAYGRIQETVDLSINELREREGIGDLHQESF
jgi:hypothetical protein